MAALLYAYNRPDHRWKRDLTGDLFALVTDVATIALLVGLTMRLIG